MVHLVGLEPTSLAALEPESSVCANFTTGATGRIVYHNGASPVNGVSDSGVSRFLISARQPPPFVADAGLQFPPQAHLLRRSIGPPTSFSRLSRAIRRRVAGAPARSRNSSLRSRAENKPPPSAIPLGKTSGCRPSTSYACKLSFLTRRTPASPPPEHASHGEEGKNAVRFSV